MSSATGSNAPGEDDPLDRLAVLQYYQANQLHLYIASAGFAFLFFEYLITFNREFRYIRDHKRTWAKTMFILNRYMSLLQAAATLFSAVLPVSFFVRRTIEVLQIALYAVWAVFSALRVYALSNNDRVIVAIVGLLSSAPVITFTFHIRLILRPAPWVTIQLWMYFKSVSVLILQPMDKVFNSYLFMTFMRIWNVALRRDESPMVQIPRLILKEGVLYFLAMLLVNSTQIIADFLYNTQFTAACIMFNLLVPMLVSRFYLNLHDVRKAEDERKAEELASNLEKTKSFRKSKPLPPIPYDGFDDTKISYLNEVFQYNSRVLGRGATRA
ncbi:hypothetical protein V8D89_014271 [Ganoderma adspersum]